MEKADIEKKVKMVTGKLGKELHQIIMNMYTKNGPWASLWETVHKVGWKQRTLTDTTWWRKYQIGNIQQTSWKVSVQEITIWSKRRFPQQDQGPSIKYILNYGREVIQNVYSCIQEKGEVSHHICMYTLTLSFFQFLATCLSFLTAYGVLYYLKKFNLIFIQIRCVHHHFSLTRLVSVAMKKTFLIWSILPNKR